MAKVAVPVLRPLTYQGRFYVRGDVIRLEAIEAAALAQQRKVTLTKGVVIPRELRAEATTNAPQRRRRQYRRRDLAVALVADE